MLKYVSSDKKCNTMGKIRMDREMINTRYFSEKGGRQKPPRLSAEWLFVVNFAQCPSKNPQSMAQLTPKQRYTISAMHKEGYSQSSIARVIEKDRSVVSRELKRNRNEKGEYHFYSAQQLSDIRKLRLRKARKLTCEVTNRIERYLKNDQWSPEQIVGYSERNGYKMVSKSTIYEYIHKDKEEGGTLYLHCRHKLKHRARPVGYTGPIKDRVSIEERPAEVNGKRFGDWELDLIVGQNNKDAMVTLVERQTNFALIEKLPNGKKAHDVADAVYRMLLPFKNNVLTITTDNGAEFALHKEIARKLKTKIYFAHPYCSWEKGAIEHTNKLFRQYIPKKSSFELYNQKEIKRIQEKLNKRPRQKLGFLSPSEVFWRNLKNQ